MPSTASTPSAISDQVHSFLAESFLTDDLDEDAELIEILDSLQLLRTVIQLESMFGVTVDNSELTLENLGTLRRIGVFVNNKLNR